MLAGSTPFTALSCDNIQHNGKVLRDAVLALAQLRERLRDGGFPPGMRIAATEVADTLKLSATPVREALSRLAGEGLLEDRRGQGFFLRPLSGVDIADLYRLSLTHLAMA